MVVRLLTLALCTLLLTACAAIPVSPATATSLSSSSDAYFLASRSGDTAKTASLLASDHLFVGPTGNVQNKATRVAWLNDNQDWLPSVSVRDVQIKQFGSTGRVTGIWVIPDGGKLVMERFVHIWVLQDGAWQMISHQVTEVPAK